jgi:serine/threonine-protein kinase
LVVHRDIKPSNILVDREGGVKLLDFGIAKLLDQEDGHTAIGGRALTPAYASPEQHAGAPISTATDVYQLGLLLHELLTGARPTDDANPALHTSLRLSRAATMHFDGTPPAAERAGRRRSSPKRLARLLSGDLDTIAAMALRAEPEERYPSAGELAADVRLYLAGLPLVAHPESTSYRARKFVARHRWGVSVAVLAAVLLAGYVVTLSVQNRRVAAQRERAEREGSRALEVTEFLVSLFHAADPNETAGTERSARDLLVEGAKSREGEAVGDPGVRAAMHAAIGRSFRRLGDYTDAEKQLTLAVVNYRAAPVVDGIELARALQELGLTVRLADAPRALIIFEDARAVATAHLAQDHPALASILVDYSVVLSTVHPGDPRIESLRSNAVAMLRSADSDVRDELANALTVWARGRPPAEAIPRMREALALRREINPEVHTTVAASLSDLALATEPEDPLAADSLLTQAVSILRQIHGDRGAMLLSVINNLAAVRRDRGAFAEAEPLYREVLALRRAHYPGHLVSQANSLYGLGMVLTETGRAGEAVSHLRDALTILEREAPRSPRISIIRTALGHALTREGRFVEAERILLGVWQRREATSLSPAQAEITLRRLVTLYEAWDRPERAAHHRELLDSLGSSETPGASPERRG